MEEYNINNFIFKRGKNAEANTQLMIESDKEWYWFHLDGLPSGHVIFCNSKITYKQIRWAANLVKTHSKQKSDKNVDVIYCKVKNLIPDPDIPGSVSFVSLSHTKIIKV